MVEDDEGARRLFSRFLSGRGFTVLEAPDGERGLELAPEAGLVLLDIMLPGIDGWEVATRLRVDYPDKPIIMLTALGATHQVLHGFDLGIDDYMVKPVDLHELEARVRAVMRRAGLGAEIVRGDLVIRTDVRLVTVDGVKVDLSPLEFDLLAKLALHPGRVWSRAELLAAVWGEDYFGVDRTVDVRVAVIRGKLPGRGYIETVRNHGYRFAVGN